MGVRKDRSVVLLFFFFFQAEDGIRDLVRSRGLGDVYKRQPPVTAMAKVETATPSAQEVARQIGDDWKVAAYYELAEAAMEPAWHELLFPLLKDLSLIHI